MNRTERPSANGQKAHRNDIVVRIEEVKIYEKRTLRAFIDFTLVGLGLRINGAMIHEKDGKRWVAMPAREYSTDEGRKWAPIIDFGSKEARWALTDAVLAAYDHQKSCGTRP